jgi:hypothetical protein
MADFYHFLIFAQIRLGFPSQRLIPWRSFLQRYKKESADTYKDFVRSPNSSKKHHQCYIFCLDAHIVKHTQKKQKLSMLFLHYGLGDRYIENTLKQKKEIIVMEYNNVLKEKLSTWIHHQARQ